LAGLTNDAIIKRIKIKNMKKQGFTLIELIIVVAIIALLAAATFVAVDPAKRIGQANDAQRWSAVTALADAYMTYLVDHNGTAPTTTTNGVTYFIQHEIGGAVINLPDIGSCVATTSPAIQSMLAVDLGALVNDGYIGQIPVDPVTSSDVYNDGSGYYFYRDAMGKMIIGACASSTYGSDAVIRVVR
jgi:prepilin-type N-terminal cleavage/methylation domain-containing protein